MPIARFEYVSSDSDKGTPGGKTAAAKCSDCVSAICADCRLWCCGESFCQWCGDYHRTHDCLRKPVQIEQLLMIFFHRCLLFLHGAFYATTALNPTPSGWISTVAV